MAEPYRRKGSKFWWISPVVDGVQENQSSGTTDYDEARTLLRQIEGDIAHGVYVSSRSPLMREVLESVRRDYKIRSRRSLPDLERRLDKHLLPALGHIRAGRVTESEIADYILRRQQQKAAAATINRELAVIKRAFSLERRHVPRPPRIELLPEDNARETTYSDAQFDSILRSSSALLRDLLMVYGFTGWRKTSVLSLEWRLVDLEGGWISLEAKQTKNRKRVRFPLIKGLREIFERRHHETRALEQRSGRIIPWVFHRNGNRVRSVRKAFIGARARAGLPGHRLHDFRRMAVQTLHTLGYDVKTIKDLCGFKTFVMVERYIGMTSDERLLEAGKDLELRRAGTAVGAKGRDGSTGE